MAIINDIRKIEEVLNELYNSKRRLLKNNEVRKCTLRTSEDKIAKEYAKELSIIANEEKHYVSIINNNENIIKQLDTMVDMIPEKDRIGNEPRNVCCPKEVDVNYVIELFENITKSGFGGSIKRLLRMGGNYAYKDMVKDFLQLVEEDKLYFNNLIKKLKQEKEEKISRLKQECEDKNELNKKHHVQQIINLKHDEDRETAEINSKEYEFFKSTLVSEFTKRIDDIFKDSEALEEDWQDYNPKRKRNNKIVIGNQLIAYDVKSTRLKQKLLSNISKYANNEFVKLPLVIDTIKPLKIRVRYSKENKLKANKFIQYMLLNMLRNAPINTYDIYVFDPEGRGSSLGYLNAAIKENQKIGIYVHNSQEEIVEALMRLERETDEINALIGTYSSLDEYNKQSNNTIKERIIVGFDYFCGGDKDNELRFLNICTNSLRTGTHIILNDGEVYPPHLSYRDNSYMFIKDGWNFVVFEDDKETTTYNVSNYDFAFSKLNIYHKTFMEAYRKNYDKGLVVDTSFTSVIVNKQNGDYDDATNGIYLPVLIRDGLMGEVYNLPLGVDDKSVHSLITGGTGAGKTTFLHTIISSIVTKYHPDDVELWLVDYGIEFASSLTLTPPHVRFVSIENSKEFTYSFLDHLQKVVNERKRAFIEAGNVTDIKEYREIKGKLSMPRIVIIVDEFHNMAQYVSDDSEYVNILENILREVRKFGITCIFSDQTYSGLRGLTSTAKMQIRSRFAMSNEINEMKDTLGVSSRNFDSEKEYKMERTAKGELWYSEWVDSNNFVINKFKDVYASKDERKEAFLNAINKNIELINDSEIIKVGLLEDATFPLEEVKEIVKTDNQFSVPMVLGKPTTLDKYFKFEFVKKYTNNAFIVGQNMEMQKTLLLNVFANLSILGNKKILIFADPYNQLFINMQAENLYNIDNCEVCVHSNIAEICEKINQIEKKVSSREIQESDVFIFWFGLGDIFIEFENSPEKQQSKIEEPLSGYKKEVSEIQKAKLEKSDFVAKRSKEIGITPREFVERYVKQEEMKPTSIDENSIIYNAKADALTLFNKGSRFGFFNFVLFDSVKEITSRSDIKENMFAHKFLLNMSKGDLAEFYIRYDEVNLTNNTVLYTKDELKQKFKPYKL